MAADAPTLDGRTLVEPDGSAMAELYTRYVPSGVRLAYLLTGDRHQAEDLAHEAFVRCVGRFQHLRSHVAFDAYLRSGASRHPRHAGRGSWKCRFPGG
jgi:DNA-directed RNA polymerase specialized sigma24 family protein